MAHIEKLSVETITTSLIQGKIDVNELNLAFANQRTAFLNALLKRPHILNKVSKTNLAHFIPVALKENPEYFLYLNKDQYESSFVQTYLVWRLEKDKNERKPNKFVDQQKKNFLIHKSYDDKIVFQYNYSTSENDELYYDDQELNIPLSLKSSFKISLKLTDPLDFIEHLDIDIATLGENKIMTTLTDTLSAKYKAFLHEYIRKNKLGYYSLCVSVNEIEESFKDKVEKDFKKYGLEVVDFIIKALAIPKEIQKRVEDLAFQIRQQRAEAEANSNLAQIALDNYKAKLELEEQHPSSTHTLTEYEKDQALRRYLIKNGRSAQEEIDRSIKISANHEEEDKSINKGEDIVPDIEPKPNTFKTTFIALLAISLFLSLFVLLMGEIGVGCILLGATCLIFGLVAAFNVQKFKDSPVEISEGESTNDGRNDNQ